MTPIVRALSAAAQLALAPRDPTGCKGRQAAKVKQLSAAAFTRIPTNLPDESALPAPWCKLASQNRYHDIIPNSHSRVLLQRLGDDPLTEYINANHVRGSPGSDRAYIATQGPTPRSASDFWRLVWEQRCTNIVMLTGLVESGRPKCERYWPEAVGPEARVRHGDLEVAALAVEEAEAYVHSILHVQPAGSGESGREVHHFWYHTWPDHGVPSDNHGVLEMLRAVRLHGKTDPSAPWVVHCSAGIGRTGAFIGIDMGVHQLATLGFTDVLQLVKAMREDRGGMVQTAQQADFVYRTLLSAAAEMSDSLNGAAWRDS